MRVSDRKVLLGFLFAPILAATQTSVPGNPNAKPALTPNPALTKPQSQPPLRSAPAARVLNYSPAAIDFGTVNFNGSSLKTFSLTSPTAVEVELKLLNAGFTPVELRRVPAMAQGSSARVAIPHTRPVRFEFDDFYDYYKWTLTAGEEMQLDIVCTPNYEPAFHHAMAGGPFNWDGQFAMQVTGGRSTKTWQLSIPLRGVVLGAPHK